MRFCSSATGHVRETAAGEVALRGFASVRHFTSSYQKPVRAGGYIADADDGLMRNLKSALKRYGCGQEIMDMPEACHER